MTARRFRHGPRAGPRPRGHARRRRRCQPDGLGLGMAPSWTRCRRARRRRAARSRTAPRSPTSRRSRRRTRDGRLVAEAIDKVGKDHVITVESSNTLATGSTFAEGLQFDKGYRSPSSSPHRGASRPSYDTPRAPGQRPEDLRARTTCSRSWRRCVAGGRPLLIVAGRRRGRGTVDTRRRTRSAHASTPSRSSRPTSVTGARAFMTDLAVVTGGQVVARTSASSSTTSASRCSAPPGA